MKTKIIIMLITAVSCFFIYKFSFRPEKIYTVLGDSFCDASTVGGLRITSYNNLLFNYLNELNKFSSYNDDYCQRNLSIEELTNLINNNNSINKRHIQNVLDNSTYITIAIGVDEISSYKKFANIKQKEFLDNYDKLLKLVGKYSKGKVIVIGFYSNKFKELNSKLKQICLNNNAKYIDISLIGLYFPNYSFKNSNKLNNQGQLKTFEIIKDNL